MPESGRDITIVFAESLSASVVHLLGQQTVVAIFARTFPKQELVFTSKGGIEANTLHPKEHVRRLTGVFAQLLADSFGHEFADRSVADAYTRAVRSGGTIDTAADILACIPEGFLEKEKIKLLSKSELEERVLQRTIELQEANARLEERVAQRTEELVSANSKLEDANKELSRLSSVKSEFLSMVSHQLLVPLTAARWIAKTLEEELSDAVSEETRKLLDQLLASNAHMARLVANLLNVARIEDGRTAYAKEIISLSDLLKDIVTVLSPLAAEKRVTLRYAADEFCSVRGDRDALRMAFENIIDNAVKYTPEGKMVMVTLGVIGKTVRVKVADQGIGIPIGEQGQIFGKFYRARNARAVQTNGSGLGLFVVKKIIEGHEGHVRFESSEDTGTTFFIELPISAD